MAKTTAPLLSFGASGTIAKTAVYSKWKGRPYTRRHVVPANPQTAAQTQTRSAFAFSSNAWKVMGALGVAPWDRFAVGQVLTGRNAWMGRYVADNRGETDLAQLQMSPGAKGGLPPDNVTFVATAGGVDVTFTNPTPPSGWTIEAVVAQAMLDQNPETGTDYGSTALENDTTFDVVSLVGLTPASLYVVGGWIRWAKPDLSIAYSVSIMGSATPT